MAQCPVYSVITCGRADMYEEGGCKKCGVYQNQDHWKKRREKEKEIQEGAK